MSMTEMTDHLVRGRASRHPSLFCLALAFACLSPALDVAKAYAQDLEMDSPEESGPIGVQPTRPVTAPPLQQPEKQPAVQAQPDRLSRHHRRNRNDGRLRVRCGQCPIGSSNVVTADNGQNATAVVGRVQFSSEYRGKRDGSVQLENVAEWISRLERDLWSEQTSRFSMV